MKPLNFIGWKWITRGRGKFLPRPSIRAGAGWAILFLTGMWLASALPGLAQENKFIYDPRFLPPKNINPKRIVSLAPSITETIYALGVQDRLVGVTKFCNYPPEAQKKEIVGGIVDPNLEKILSLKPDLVVGTPEANDVGVAVTLTKLGIPFLGLYPHNVEDILTSIMTLGEYTQSEKTARQVVDKIRLRVQRVQDAVNPLPTKKVLYTYGREFKVCAGPNTFADHLIELANGVNVLKDSILPYPRVNIEEIIKRKPDVILISPMATGENLQIDTSYLDRWEGVPAVKDKQIYVVADFVDRPSPRIADALEAMASMIHPGLTFRSEEKNDR